MSAEGKLNTELTVAMNDDDVRQSHHQSVRGVHSLHPSYTASVRLVLLWLGGHFLSGLLSQETVEMIMASVYLSPDRILPPTCPTAGFLQFLKR